jgi:RecA/RadA recombinase
MSLLSKMKKNSKIVGTNVLSESEFFGEKSFTRLDVPMLNVALTGRLDGGISCGLTTLAGPSKHFKTSFALKIASSFLKSDPEAVLLFYDSEFGSPQSYFESFEVDPNRVLHVPVQDMEQLKFDLVNQLKEIEKTDKVIIIIDSIGNLASRRELDNALDEKSVADMTRAKELKGLFRMVTPTLTTKDVPLIAINHTYKEIGLFPKDIVGGGTGIYYSSDNIWIIGRRQNKSGTEVEGYDFVIKVEKSRFVKEQSKIPITVTWEGGIEKYSGLLDVALASGHVTKPSNGWYQKGEGAKVRQKETLTEEFWSDILSDESFQNFVKNQFTIGQKSEAELEIEIIDDETP